MTGRWAGYGGSRVIPVRTIDDRSAVGLVVVRKAVGHHSVFGRSIRR